MSDEKPLDNNMTALKMMSEKDKEIDALRSENKVLREALVEETARRMWAEGRGGVSEGYGLPSIWSGLSNGTKEHWHKKAQAALTESGKEAKR